MAVTLRQYVIGFILFGGLLTGILSFSGAVFDAYDEDVDQSALNDVATNVNDRMNRTVSEGRRRSLRIGGGSAIGGVSFFLNSVWQTILTVLETLTMIPTIVGEIAFELNLPDWIVFVAVGIPSAIVIFEVISLYRGLRT